MIDLKHNDHFSFDLWMTLIKSNPEFKPRRTELFKDIFSLNNDIRTINNTIRYYDILFNEISQITGKHFQREEAFLIILDKLGKDIKTININDLKNFFSESDKLFLEYLPQLLMPKIFDLLKTIETDGKTASILSNTAFIHGDILRIALQKLELGKFFSFMIFSDEVGFSKPNKELFMILYQNTQNLRPVTKDKIIHIGDNIIADYNGALNFGINAELVKF